MKITTLAWINNKVRIIDQTKLPNEFKYLYIDSIKDMRLAVRALKVRGAPALGACGVLGVYLGIKDSSARNWSDFKRDLERAAVYMACARPTARNLFWGIERAKQSAFENKNKSIAFIKSAILSEAKKVIAEDKISCRKIGYYGEKLLKDKDKVLTVCNAGILATIDYGTALAVIYSAKANRKQIKVYSCETRPLLQGSRLTAWELNKKGIEISVICDNTAGYLMKEGKVDLVIAGADRIALNGDTANKIGTLNLAILCRYHRIPFYIAAPQSTFDLKLKSGKDIPIELRDPEEVNKIMLKKRITPKEVKVFNPAFDVTSHTLISAIITDKGIINPPFYKNIRKVLGE